MRVMMLHGALVGFSVGALLGNSSISAVASEESGVMAKHHIPKSVEVEHAAIHSLLVEATKAPGRVGEAARALAEVLHPHFVREEEIALPPLGLLAPLAAGETLEQAELSAVLGMTDALKRELPQMLEEHKRIRAAVDALRAAAKAERAVKYEGLADQLSLHAQSEEEVLYPAAILVGDLIRARSLVK